MLYINISDEAIDILQSKKSLVGHEKIIASSRKALQPGLVVDGIITDEDAFFSLFSEVLLTSYPIPIQDAADVSVVISDAQALTVRIPIHVSDRSRSIESTVLEEAKKIIQHDPVEYENFFTVFGSGRGGENALYTAMPISTIMHVRKFFERANLRLAFLTTRSFVLFQLLKMFLPPGQAMLVIISGKTSIEYTLCDNLGPISVSYAKISAQKHTEEVSRIVSEARGRAGQTISGVYITGEIPEGISNEITNVRDVLYQVQKKNHVIFEPSGGNPSVYLGSLGLFLSVRDETVPNFARDSSYIRESDDDALVERKQSRISLYVMMLAGLSILGGGIYMASSSDGFPMRYFIAPSPTITPKPTVLPTATPTPTVDPSLKRNDIALSVQNGSGKTGYAGEIAEFLEGKGYESVRASNADRDDYEKTLVRIKESKKMYFPLILEDLKEKFSDTKQETLEESSENDAIIILGKS